MFVRAIEGQYNLKEELARLRSLPRVIKGRELKFNDGPQAFSKHYIEPVDGLSQTLHIHLEEYSPGGHNQKHGHVNEAAFYILDGDGYEIHDGIRYDWTAGDVAVVHNNCVHQHFNASVTKPARAGHEDEADVSLHEHAVPEDRRAAAEGAGAGAGAFPAASGRRELQSRLMAARDALVAEDFAQKFATEKDTPYTRWVRAEGLDIISSFYVENLHTVELKPWARRGGRGVFLNHDA